MYLSNEKSYVQKEPGVLLTDILLFQQNLKSQFVILVFFILSSQILTSGSSERVLNSPERFLPRRPSTCFVVPKSSLVLRSSPTLTSTLLSAKRPTAPTIRPALARWAHLLTRWRSSTQTRAFWVSRGSVWSTPPSCPASLAAT